MQASEAIRRARRDAGLTQAALAARSGTSQPAVSLYESGARAPSTATLERLLAACGRRPVITLVDRPEPGAGPVGELVRERRGELRRALLAAGARNPRLFGSVATGTDGPDSDVDVLVDLARPSYLLLGRVRAAAEQVLGCRVDVSTPDLLQDDIRQRVLDEAVPL